MNMNNISNYTLLICELRSALNEQTSYKRNVEAGGEHNLCSSNFCEGIGKLPETQHTLSH